MMTKILVVSPSEFPGTSGDSANYLELTLGLSRKGLEVFLLCPWHPQGKEFDERMRDMRVSVVRVPFSPPRLRKLLRGSYLVGAARFLVFLAVETAAFIYIAVREKVRYCIIRHTLLTLTLAPLVTLLRIRSIADSGEIPSGALALRFMPLGILKVISNYERGVIRGYSFYMAFTRHQKSVITKLGFPEERIILRQISIDLSKIPIHDEAPRFTFGYFGVLERWQGLDFLLRSFSRAIKKDARLKLFVIGEGSMKGYLQTLARELGIHDKVTFCGSVPREIMLKEYFKLFRVAIIPRPPMKVPVNPIKLVEALASGKPVVATRVPGIADLVNEGEGVTFVAPNDEEDLARAILNLASNDEWENSLSKKALRTATRFDIEVQLDLLIKKLGLER